MGRIRGEEEEGNNVTTSLLLYFRTCIRKKQSLRQNVLRIRCTAERDGWWCAGLPAERGPGTGASVSSPRLSHAEETCAGSQAELAASR